MMGSDTNLQNEQIYLSKGCFLKSPSGAQVSGRDYETRIEYKSD